MKYDMYKDMIDTYAVCTHMCVYRSVCKVPMT